MAIGEDTRRRLIRRAFARDHVGRDRPWRAAKAEQRHIPAQAQLSRSRRSHKPGRGFLIGLDRQRRDDLGISIGSSFGPSPATNATLRPSACGITRISENRIAASKPKRRIGCKVTSAASSGEKQRSRNPPAFSRTARYSGRYRPACRIIQTGGMRLPLAVQYLQERFIHTIPAHTLPFFTIL